jgi:hypothetical protein
MSVFYCRVCFTIKAEKTFPGLLLKRFSNIFETYIAYFSQFFHIHSLVDENIRIMPRALIITRGTVSTNGPKIN